MKKEKDKKGEHFDNEFNELFLQKKAGFQIVKIAIFLSVACVVCSFVFGVFIFTKASSTIAVVDSNGEYLQMKIADKQKMQTVLLQQTCANLVFYLNSFDRGGYLDNYNLALNYCQTDEANKVAELYKAEKFYYDATQRGVIFVTRLNEIHNIEAFNDGSVKASFNAIMEKKDGDFNNFFIIECEGKLIKTTPEFPNNITGWIFQSYTQTIKPYNPREDVKN